MQGLGGKATTVGSGELAVSVGMSVAVSLVSRLAVTVGTIKGVAVIAPGSVGVTSTCDGAAVAKMVSVGWGVSVDVAGAGGNVADAGKAVALEDSAVSLGSAATLGTTTIICGSSGRLSRPLLAT